MKQYLVDVNNSDSKGSISSQLSYEQRQHTLYIHVHNTFGADVLLVMADININTS